MSIFSDKEKSDVLGATFNRLLAQEQTLEYVRNQLRTFRQKCDRVEQDEDYSELLKFFLKAFPEHQDRAPMFRDRKKLLVERLAILKSFLEQLASVNAQARKEVKSFIANLV